MDKTGQHGSWCYEVTGIKLRKTPSFGKPYTGVCDFTIVDGNLHVQGLLCDDFNISDAKELKHIASLFGHSTHRSIKVSKIP